MPDHKLTQALKAEAARLGFSHWGVCLAASPPGLARLESWLTAGYSGQMHYLADRLEAYRHPAHVLEGARSLMVLATDYRTVEPNEVGRGAGMVSRYAWGLDYHDVLRKRLSRLAECHRSLAPNEQVRGVVDTAPLLEREFAVLAGLGWIGKNTLLITRDRGSWLFLSVLLSTAELECDVPFAADHCGTCRACIDACPTGALVEPYVLDARRCISYLTIERKDMPPVELRDTGGWLFGCDACQNVCPWNRPKRLSRTAAAADQFRPASGETSLGLVELFGLDDAGFRSRFRSTPLWRAKRRGLLRNAALLLAHQRPPGASRALLQGLGDKEPLVRVACAWALGRIGDAGAMEGLRQRLAVENDPDVSAEIRHALA